MTGPEPGAPCPDCGAPATGSFCSSCGQRLDVDPRSLWRWILDALEDTLSLDGRLPRTLKALLFRPGLLTLEWRAGRRTRWVHPFRVYLVASLACFAVIAVTPEDRTPVTGDQVLTFDLVNDADNAALREAVRETMPTALIVGLPLFALLLKWLFRGAGWFYTEHLVTALHVHAFAFLALGATWILEPLPDGVDYVLQTPLFLWVPAYVILALRRTYGAPILALTLRAVPLFVAYPLVLLIGVTVASMFARDSERLARRASEAYWEVQDILDAGGERGRALALARKALVDLGRLEERSMTPHLRFHMGDLLLLSQQPEEARVAAELALVEDPNEVLALGLLGEAAHAAGDSAAVRDALERLLLAHPQVDRRADFTGRHAPRVARYLAWARGDSLPPSREAPERPDASG
ncbi:MAG TPA: DUF3667 domain-containing protein [Longimicrobiales bacterium]